MPGDRARGLERRDHRRAARQPCRSRTTTETRLYVYAFGVLVGTAVQLALPLPVDARARRAHRHGTSTCATRRCGASSSNMLPVTLGLGLINLNLLVSTVVRGRASTPTWPPPRSTRRSASTCCRRACSRSPSPTVAVPGALAVCRARRATGTASARTVGSGMRQIAFLLVPAAVVCAVLAEPIVRLLYERGEFTRRQTPVVAGRWRPSRSASPSTA